MGDIFTSAAIAWGVVALLFLITELMTGTLYVLCVFVGALAAFLPSFRSWRCFSFVLFCSRLSRLSRLQRAMPMP